MIDRCKDLELEQTGMMMESKGPPCFFSWEASELPVKHLVPPLEEENIIFQRISFKWDIYECMIC